MSRTQPAATMQDMADKIEGLEADLEGAVEVAFKRGATEWTRLNYPAMYEILKEPKPKVGKIL